jgi:hypothetical protein
MLLGFAQESLGSPATMHHTKQKYENYVQQIPVYAKATQ